MKIDVDTNGQLCLLDVHNCVVETLDTSTSKYCYVSGRYYNWPDILNGTANTEAKLFLGESERVDFQTRITELENKLTEVNDLIAFSKTKKGKIALISLINEAEGTQT